MIVLVQEGNEDALMKEVEHSFVLEKSQLEINELKDEKELYGKYYASL